MSGRNRIRVAFINHWAKDLGGAEHSLLAVIAAVKEDFDVHLVTTEAGPLVDRVSAMGVACHIVPCSNSVKKLKRWGLLRHLLFSWPVVVAFILYCVRLRRVIRTIHPQIIHGNVPKSHMALFFLVKTGFKGKCCIHVREIFEKRSTSKKLYTVLFPRRDCTVIAISVCVKDNLPAVMRRKAEIIYNGIPIPGRPKKYAVGETIKLLYLGRIVPWKGCHLLIDILCMARNKYRQTSLELSLVGDTMYWASDYKGLLRKKIEDRNLSHCCRLLPYTDDPVTAFEAHDIFCIASDHEPFGRSIAEAQASGMPVIAFDSGGVSEIVQNNLSGILLPFNDCKKFADALGTFIENPGLMRTMGLQGRKNVTRRFDVRQQGPLLHDYFSRLLQ